MPRIRSLRLNVSREEALEQFTQGIPGIFRSAALGPVRSVADFYVPFGLFQVTIWNAGRHDNQVLGLDSVSGSLDLYHFEHIPDSSELLSIDTRNCPPARLDVDRARDLVVEKVRRMLFQKGCFRMRNLRIEAAPLAGEICIPYWVAFRGRRTRLYISVIDAVRRKPEGAKVRQLLQAWLTTPS
ncbi:MAG: hypothetical protein ACM34E_09210 [Acidobacteriota bacterium]